MASRSIHLFTSHAPAVVVLDLNAVVGNATTACLLRTLEAGARHVPILAVSPESESERASCLSAGVDHLVTLPLDLGTVQARTRRSSGANDAAAGKVADTDDGCRRPTRDSY